MMHGRDHALPDDVQALAEPVLAHRLVLAPESPRGAGEDVVADAVVVGAGAVMTRGRRRPPPRGAGGVSLTWSRCCSTPAPLFVPGVAFVAARRGRARRGSGSRRAARASTASCTPTGWSRTSRSRRRSRSAAAARAARRRGRSIRSPARRCRSPAAVADRRRPHRSACGWSRASPAAGCESLDPAVADRPRPARARPAIGPRRRRRARRAAGAPADRARPVARPRRGSRPRLASPAHARVRADGRGRRRRAAALPPGTPASRIHWPALARGAGLLERRLQADGDSRPLVVLDLALRRAAASRLDAAVRAAASLTLELARSGGCACCCPGDRRPPRIEPRPGRLAGGPRAAGAGRGRPRSAGAGAGPPAPRVGPVLYVAAQPARPAARRHSAGCRARACSCVPTARWPRRSGCRRRSRSRAAAASRSARAAVARAPERAGVSADAQVAVMPSAAPADVRPGARGDRAAASGPWIRLADVRRAGAVRGASLVDAAASPRRRGRLLGAARRWRSCSPRSARCSSGGHRALAAIAGDPRGADRDFALAGVPLHWVTHLRIAVSADAIGHGLSALPARSCPTSGSTTGSAR